MTTHNFSYALDALKNGVKVKRNAWRDAYLWLKPGTTIKEEWCKDPILKGIVHDNGGEAKALGTICLKTANGDIMTGWTPSQEDMLADDWEEWYDRLIGIPGELGGPCEESDAQLLSWIHHYLELAECNNYLDAENRRRIRRIHKLIETKG